MKAPQQKFYKTASLENGARLGRDVEDGERAVGHIKYLNIEKIMREITTLYDRK